MILCEALYRNGGGFNFLYLQVVLGQTAPVWFPFNTYKSFAFYSIWYISKLNLPNIFMHSSALLLHIHEDFNRGASGNRVLAIKSLLQAWGECHYQIQGTESWQYGWCLHLFSLSPVLPGLCCGNDLGTIW